MQRHLRLTKSNGSEQVVYCSGDWTALTAPVIEKEFSSFLNQLSAAGNFRVNLEEVDQFDTAGALLVTRLARSTDKDGTLIEGGAGEHRRLLDRIAAASAAEIPAPQRKNSLLSPFVIIGQNVAGSVKDFVDANNVQGRLIAAFGATLIGRARLRFPAFVNQFQLIVLGAIPIVTLISLVVGAIITQQTIIQLRNFGATIFVVDLAAILMFREIGILMAAIMVAGRSGSAITAELGSMRMREEFDALRVMGVDPYQALLLPRILALIVGLPLLTFIASMAGLLGSFLVARFYGEIPTDIFINRLQDSMTIVSVSVGLIKAPFMGFLVGLIACIEGLKVAGSAESLGRHTTSSVVKAIFIVILADGLFAMFFAAIGY